MLRFQRSRNNLWLKLHHFPYTPKFGVIPNLTLSRQLDAPRRKVHPSRSTTYADSSGWMIPRRPGFSSATLRILTPGVCSSRLTASFNASSPVSGRSLVTGLASGRLLFVEPFQLTSRRFQSFRKSLVRCKKSLNDIDLGRDGRQ